MKKIITSLTLLAFIAYSCNTDDEVLSNQQVSTTGIDNKGIKLEGDEALKALEEINASNEWKLIAKGEKESEERVSNGLISLPASSPLNITQGLEKLGITTGEITQATSTFDKWLAHFEVFKPYAVFFNDKDVLNNQYGYTPKYVGSRNRERYGYVPFAIKAGKPSVSYDRLDTQGKEVHEFYIINESNLTDESTQSYSYEQGVEESVNVSAGVSLGFEAKIGVPMFAESSFSVGVELSTGYSNTRSTVKTIAAEYTAQMPPRTKRKIRIVTDLVNVDARYKIPYVLNGNFEAYYYYQLEHTGGRSTPDGDKTRNIFPASTLDKYIGNQKSAGSISYLKKSNVQVFAGPAIPLD
ncbi:ETX/MTX2 family pore-forming toxin [Tenacibaculum maritimum]|uniref:Probable lipoprotein n=1 Tax=Tenacibaculum maritimum NCIMB 2154 TaxID=1349785 RepID=A0A2H1E9X1_9FLAO|nr:ETX/MTX2 family pore-forming toxin [Tenacibaculum maritimum]SFZ82464.1 Probable lipoprotein precursor [Tenacibaculum maritimum NCIMB 2154]